MSLGSDSFGFYEFSTVPGGEGTRHGPGRGPIQAILPGHPESPDLSQRARDKPGFGRGSLNIFACGTSGETGFYVRDVSDDESAYHVIFWVMRPYLTQAVANIPHRCEL